MESRVFGCGSLVASLDRLSFSISESRKIVLCLREHDRWHTMFTFCTTYIVQKCLTQQQLTLQISEWFLLMFCFRDIGSGQR
jgi:hypothetical protein